MLFFTFFHVLETTLEDETYSTLYPTIIYTSRMTTTSRVHGSEYQQLKCEHMPCVIQDELKEWDKRLSIVVPMSSFYLWSIKWSKKSRIEDLNS